MLTKGYDFQHSTVWISNPIRLPPSQKNLNGGLLNRPSRLQKIRDKIEINKQQDIINLTILQHSEIITSFHDRVVPTFMQGLS